jgi:hypothetical protein
MDRVSSVGALAVGGVLAVPFALFVALYDGEPALATATALGLFLPFAAFAVATDPDPATLLPPRPVLLAGTALGVLAVAVGALTDAPATGLVAGALAVAPATAHHGRYAATALAPPVVELGGPLAVVCIVAVGALAAAPVATGVAAVLVTAATVDYLRERRRLTRRTRRVAGGVALLGAAGVTVGGVLLEQALTGIAGGAALLVLGAALAVE